TYNSKAAESGLPTRVPDSLWAPVHCTLNTSVRSRSEERTFKKKMGGNSGTVVEKSYSHHKMASSIPCRSVLEQDTEPLIAPDVQCAISVNVKCVYIVSRTYVSRFG